MIAVVRHIDRGPEEKRDIYAHWCSGQSHREICYHVTYHAHYASPLHRQRGLLPAIVVTKIEVEIDGEWKPAQLDKQQREALRDVIEADEELHAPLGG